jgi:hypothetical protein
MAQGWATGERSTGTAPQGAAPVALQLAPYPVVGSDKVWAVPKDADGAPYVTQHRFVVD